MIDVNNNNNNGSRQSRGSITKTLENSKENIELKRKSETTPKSITKDDDVDE